MGGRAAAAVVATCLASACLVEIQDLVPSDGSGGAGGAGGVGGAGGAATMASAGGGGAALGPCPPDMVHATDDASISFCIDRTEVTRAAYVQFLASVGNSVPVSEQPSACSFNTSLTHSPDGSCPDFTTGSQLPVNCVDWCDAHAYCNWAGKRLCRALAGGPLVSTDSPTIGEWHFACTGGLTTVYPYGNQPDDDACNIPDSSARAEVGTFAGCEGGFPGIFDMQGNVTEYVDACDPDAVDAACALRGGHTFGTAQFWTCNNTAETNARNNPNEREIGFRCCRDAGS